MSPSRACHDGAGPALGGRLLLPLGRAAPAGPRTRRAGSPVRSLLAGRLGPGDAARLPFSQLACGLLGDDGRPLVFYFSHGGPLQLSLLGSRCCARPRTPLAERRFATAVLPSAMYCRTVSLTCSR